LVSPIYTRPPRPPLFTYTTLFRSSNTLLLGEKWLRPDQYEIGSWMDDHNLISALDQDGMRIADRPPVPDTNNNPFTSTPVTASQDRKSTRLNSSHQIISYAVFCLK